MAKAYEAPPGVDIAAIRNRGKAAAAMDLMKPGPGTPWEDRGAQGLIKAFMQTCVKSITSPAMLLDHIRRPDTTGEARQFAIACSVLWGISAGVHMLLYYLKSPPAWDLGYTPDYQTSYYIKIGVMSVLTAGGVFLLGVMFANRMYYAMVSTELRNAAPRVLLYNMFCYCLGPSILALIPVAGPPLALLFIYIAWCAGGAKRLYISWRGAIVAATLTMLACLVMAAGGWLVAGFVLNNILGLRPPTPEELGIQEPAFK